MTGEDHALATGPEGAGRTLSDRLDRMRRAIPGCSLVSFGDLRTGLALRSSASRPVGQDYLETLLRQAAVHFAAHDALSEILQEDGSDQSLILATSGGLRIFVRASRDPSDVVCCLCIDAEAEADVRAHAQEVFRHLRGEA